MHPFLSRFAQALLWRGIICIVFGFLTLLWPGITLAVFLAFFGAFILLDGIVGMVTAIRRVKEDNDWWWLLLQAFIGILLGAVTLFAPFVTAVVLIYYIAGWLLFIGLLEIVIAIRLKRRITGEIWYIAGGLLSILTSIVLIGAPLRGAISIAWLVGAYAILFGILLIGASYRIKKKG